MHPARKRTSPVRWLAIAALLTGASIQHARADPIITPIKFSTTTGGNVGEDWTGPVQFEGIASGEFNSPGLVELGSFRLEGLPAKTTMSVDDLPFLIQLWVWQPGDPLTGTDAAVVHIEGRIDGSMKGANQSSMYARITSVSSPSTSPPLPFDLNNLQVQMPFLMVPSTQGTTKVYGYLSVPEPTAMATLFAGGLLVVYGHRRHRRKAA